MAGFYIHIPFCRKVCYYCDFHFVASLKSKDRVLEAIKKEIEHRSTEWKSVSFDTIYFGGGTPSVLSIDEINNLTKTIFDNYTLAQKPEFTFEANPDDLSPEYLQNLKNNTEINRLSIGIQSFNDKILQFMNRRHNSAQAIDSVIHSQKAGFENITIDLIYGVPGLDNIEWEKAIQTFLNFGINHLAAYHLSIEPKTVFGVMQKKNKIRPVNEDISLIQYRLLADKLKTAGFEHYEISNFAKPGRYSKHNTSYWQNIPYIGIGPSAHSYNGNLRRWNVSNNTQYCNSILDSDGTFFEEEILTPDEKFNDYILTSLRTMWGASLAKIENDFGAKYSDYCISILEKPQLKDHINIEGQKFKISENSWLIADNLMSEFFMV